MSEVRGTGVQSELVESALLKNDGVRIRGGARGGALESGVDRDALPGGS